MKIKRPNKKHRDEILQVAYGVAVVQPLMVIPQVYQIFKNQSAADVSLITWSLLLVFNTFNMIYGWAFNIKPLVINNTIWMVVDLLVVVGILVYR